eukprot:COSAG02_NODE_4886_length_4863_cov_9.058144_7_plen_70_part_00
MTIDVIPTSSTIISGIYRRTGDDDGLAADDAAAAAASAGGGALNEERAYSTVRPGGTQEHKSITILYYY